MTNSKNKLEAEGDLRGFLKNQHKKVYSLCRFFASNYKEHQQLFSATISAASHNIRHKKENDRTEKHTLLMKACLNMAALHSICLLQQEETDRTIQFKSPDYQRSMEQFSSVTSRASDFEKLVLFLETEKNSSADIKEMIGSSPAPAKQVKDRSVKSFIPYLIDKLIWS